MRRATTRTRLKWGLAALLLAVAAGLALIMEDLRDGRAFAERGTQSQNRQVREYPELVHNARRYDAYAERYTAIASLLRPEDYENTVAATLRRREQATAVSQRLNHVGETEALANAAGSNPHLWAALAALDGLEGCTLQSITPGNHGTVTLVLDCPAASVGAVLARCTREDTLVLARAVDLRRSGETVRCTLDLAAPPPIEGGAQ